MDQPHLGSHRDGRDELREGVRGAQPEQPVRRRVGTVALHRREPGHAQHERACGNAEAMRAAYDVGIRQRGQRRVGGLPGQPDAEHRLLQRARARRCSRSRASRRISTSTSRSPRSGSPSTRCFTRCPASATSRSSRPRARRSCATCCAAQNNPWMFHQANLRDLGGGQSLITTFLDAVLKQVRRARDVSGREPDDGGARPEDEGAHGVRRVGRQRDDRARRRS